uniref:NADH:flavin oxidoreductase/NADH oxidase N-terminal domain-containing protein n=1 Tax=Panagrolaimus sp. PS1159 TaxID=55785 RepID=A0AC35G558_9BILA
MFKRYPVEKPVSPEILNEPIKFRTSKRVAKNRLLKGAMSERLGTWIDGNLQKSGIPTEQYVNLYDKFGHGGFGTILTGNIMVDFDHLEGAGNVIIEESINNHERRQAFRDVSAAAKVDGSLIIGQISHCGSQTTTLFNPHPYSSSDVQIDSKKIGMEFGKPIALSIDEIQTLVIQKFIFAAKFLYETGFDGVEIHGANGFLLSQFMSPKSNKRTDEYGGSRENRIRIVLEIYNGIREVVPSETGFIVGIKMNSVEFENEGLSVEEAAWMCQEFEVLLIL